MKLSVCLSVQSTKYNVKVLETCPDAHEEILSSAHSSRANDDKPEGGSDRAGLEQKEKEREASKEKKSKLR